MAAGTAYSVLQLSTNWSVRGSNQWERDLLFSIPVQTAPRHTQTPTESVQAIPPEARAAEAWC